MPLHRECLPEPLPTVPLELAAQWLAAAVRAGLQPNPNAMVLATADSAGRPSARVVLCKELLPVPGCLTFFSNYESRKGLELTANPHAAVVMHWDAQRRQVRIEGRITRIAAADSDAYFSSRPWQSRIGAWASRQSAAIGSRTELEAAVAATARRFGTPRPDDAIAPGVNVDTLIPRPPHWGGYRLWAQSVELWVEGSGRIHDRARWTRSLHAEPEGEVERFVPGPWTATRLQP